MSMSNYLENEILDHIFGKSWTAPMTLYIGISGANPGETGSSFTEPFSSGNGYARIATTSGDWAVASGGVVVNSSAMAFPAANSSWGIVSYAGVFSAASSGNMLWGGTLTTSKDVSQGDTLVFSGGDLQFSLD